MGQELPSTSIAENSNTMLPSPVLQRNQRVLPHGLHILRGGNLSFVVCLQTTDVVIRISCLQSQQAGMLCLFSRPWEAAECCRRLQVLICLR